MRRSWRSSERILIKAGSAAEALQLLLKRNVAIILIDVCMPDLDGFQLASMIREHPRFQKTAIIFVSAMQVTDLDLLRGYELGAVDYVPVPVIPELLRAKVKVFAELYRKTRQLEALNTELEQRVAERTAELAQANEELERRVEERTREREAALAQVHAMQKLESLGQLTGGVAHDFNNLLMAVLGNLDLVTRYLPNDSRALRLVDGAIQAAERGAALTKRMLAFARRQELRPESVDLAKLLGGMAEMLRCSLGPMVQIKTEFRIDLPPIRVDPSQLELALLNLAVNARDAMPDGGSLTITGYREQVAAGDVAGSGTRRLRVHQKSKTRVVEWTRPRSSGRPSRSSRPRVRVVVPAWGCRWWTALSPSRTAPFASKAGQTSALMSSSGFRCRIKPTRTS